MWLGSSSRAIKEFSYSSSCCDKLDGVAPHDGAPPGAGVPSIGAQALRYLLVVIDAKVFEELRSRIDDALRNSPAQDMEKNLRALLAAWFDRLDLVLREDFEVQKKLLERAQAKLAELEARIAELEARKPQ
jgi:ubiquinone biosynthesis accessory factor UbiK